MTYRGQLLINSGSLYMLAHLIPAIVVPVCVTAMVGHLWMMTALSPPPNTSWGVE